MRYVKLTLPSNETRIVSEATYNNLVFRTRQLQEMLERAEHTDEQQKRAWCLRRSLWHGLLVIGKEHT